MQAGTQLWTPKDAMYLREIDNFTLARWYLSNAIEENKRRVAEEAKKCRR